MWSLVKGNEEWLLDEWNVWLDWFGTVLFGSMCFYRD